MSVIEAIKEAI